MELESAIPPSLTLPRTQPLRGPADFTPPVNAYSSRYPNSVKDLVIAILGVQHKSEADSSRSDALTTLVTFVKDVADNHRPKYWELAACADPTGAYNQVLIAYWPSEVGYKEWASTSGFEAWWQSSDREHEPNGWFKEILLPSIDRLETVFSNDSSIEGVAHMQTEMSGPIREHVYWGSMRDRMPIAQVDALAGDKVSLNGGSRSTASKRVRIPGHQNLAIIRSGQDWSQMKGDEREEYLKEIHPVLIKGMDFLRDQGEEVGCISNRFMEVLDSNTLKPDQVNKTFGLGYFDDLSSLEGWSKRHKTHLDIFGRFMQYAKEYQGNIALRLFHEVLVLESQQQDFEYIGCHPKTGLLAIV